MAQKPHKPRRNLKLRKPDRAAVQRLQPSQTLLEFRVAQEPKFREFVENKKRADHFDAFFTGGPPQRLVSC
jgi:hypothetical protein